MMTNLVLPPSELILDPQSWIKAADLSGHEPDRRIRQALLYPNLLTRLLASTFQDPVTVELLALSPVDGGFRRDVALRAGERLCVVASTLMPESLVDHYPWLGSLGNRPLGQTLERFMETPKGPFEYRIMDPAEGLELGFRSRQPTWGRRFTFTLPEGGLTVMEIFSHGTLEQAGEWLMARYAGSSTTPSAISS